MNQNEPMDKAAKEPEEVRKAKEGMKSAFVPCRLF